MVDQQEPARWVPVAHGWVMFADAHNFTIGRKARSKKTGRVALIRQRYYTSPEAAIGAIMREVIRDDMKSGDISNLQGIVDRVEEFHSLLTRMFELRIAVDRPR